MSNKIYVLVGSWYDYDASAHWNIAAYENRASVEKDRATATEELAAFNSLVKKIMAATSKSGYTTKSIAIQEAALIEARKIFTVDMGENGGGYQNTDTEYSVEEIEVR